MHSQCARVDRALGLALALAVGLRLGALSFGAARDVLRCDAMRCSLTNTSRRPNQFLSVLVSRRGTPVLGLLGCWLARLTSSEHCRHCNGPVFAASALSVNAAGSPPRWLFVRARDSQAPGSLFGMPMKVIAFPLPLSLCARPSSRLVEGWVGSRSSAHLCPGQGRQNKSPSSTSTATNNGRQNAMQGFKAGVALSNPTEAFFSA